MWWRIVAGEVCVWAGRVGEREWVVVREGWREGGKPRRMRFSGGEF